MATHISAFYEKPDVLEYWRKPTKEEIKFGHDATHYRNFDFDSCFDENNILKLKVKVSVMV